MYRIREMLTECCKCAVVFPLETTDKNAKDPRSKSIFKYQAVMFVAASKTIIAGLILNTSGNVPGVF